MIYDKKTGRLVASDGTEFYANQGTVGINHELSISEGYDGPFTAGGWDDANQRWEPLTPEHRRELAEYMIGLWTRFRDEI